MVAKKQAPAKKAAAKKAAAKKEEAESTRSLGANDPDFQAKVVDLRDNQEMKWSEIADELDCTAGKAILAYDIVNMPAKDKIKAKDEDELAAAIVSARDDDQNSWGRISARAGIPESRVRKIYEDATGNSSRGLRIGKGGRYVGDENPNPPAEKVKGTAKKAGAAKKAPAKKAAAAKKAAPAKRTTGAGALTSMDQEALAERIDGKTIQVQQGERKVRVKVKHVISLEDGVVNLADDKGANRSFEVSDIKGVGR